MSVQTPVTPKIEHIRDPKHPQFRFEWHPNTEKVYIVQNPGKFEDGEWVPDYGFAGSCPAFILAEHCEHHARFFGFVQTYLRGYKQGLYDAKLRGNTNVSENAPGVRA
jgi:hypothetical protein